MSEATPSESQPKSPRIVDNLLGYLRRTVDEADETAAAERVADLRAANPGASDRELVDMLIKGKSRRTGAIGAVSSGTNLIPGLGTLTSLTLGAAADIGLTFVAQVDLVLEIAAVYGHDLSPAEKKRVVLIVTGASSGANRLLSHAGGLIATRVGQRFTRRFFIKAIPVVGVGASAAANVLATQIIGHRANAYFEFGPDAVGSWADSVRIVVGVDERQIIAWLNEKGSRSLATVSDAARDLVAVTKSSMSRSSFADD
jgi:uncharacterized protein (DUF697 family)